jgi:hypothetical protein
MSAKVPPAAAARPTGQGPEPACTAGIICGLLLPVELASHLQRQQA